mgnify:CR=1 FL=1
MKFPFVKILKTISFSPHYTNVRWYTIDFKDFKRIQYKKYCIRICIQNPVCGYCYYLFGYGGFTKIINKQSDIENFVVAGDIEFIILSNGEILDSMSDMYSVYLTEFDDYNLIVYVVKFGRIITLKYEHKNIVISLDFNDMYVFYNGMDWIQAFYDQIMSDK